MRCAFPEEFEHSEDYSPFFVNILILIILRILTSQVFSKFILPHPAVEYRKTHSAISVEMALISKKTASRVPGSRFCQLIFLLVEKEIVLCGVVRPDVFDAFVDLAVIVKFFKILHYFKRRNA